MLAGAVAGDISDASFIIVPPVLNSLWYPGAGYLRSGDGFKPASRLLIGVYNDDLCGTSGGTSTAFFLEPALNLVMKSAPKNVLCMQVCRRQRVAKENQLFGR